MGGRCLNGHHKPSLHNWDKEIVHCSFSLFFSLMSRGQCVFSITDLWKAKACSDSCAQGRSLRYVSTAALCGHRDDTYCILLPLHTHSHLHTERCCLKRKTVCVHCSSLQRGLFSVAVKQQRAQSLLLTHPGNEARREGEHILGQQQGGSKETIYEGWREWVSSSV